MNVFVLSTGRCGSTTFAKACQAISNYTADHESERRRQYGDFTHRYLTLKYPDNHIEIDNRLSWHLGALDELYGKEAFYVHLLRDRDEVAQSHLSRWEQRKTSIIFAYAWGILTHPYDQAKNLSSDDRLVIGKQYWDTVNANIRLFLKDKPLQATIWLDNIVEGFESFWHAIDAQGNISSALSAWDTVYNKSLTDIGDLEQALLDIGGDCDSCILVDDGAFGEDAANELGFLPYVESAGKYWGRPKDSEHAIFELERLREAGAAYLAFIPDTYWWLEYYTELQRHLERKYSLVSSSTDTVIYQLTKPELDSP